MFTNRRPRAIREDSIASDASSSHSGTALSNARPIEHQDGEVSESNDSEEDEDESVIDVEGEEQDPIGEYEEAVAASALSDTSSNPEEDNDPTSISFGALARAQASLQGTDSRKRKRDAHPPPFSSSSTIQSTRHTGTISSSDPNDHTAEALERKAGQKKHKDNLLLKKQPSHTRTRLSKHAPTELTSKRAVSRKRSVVGNIPKREARDPRFESALGPLNEQKVKSNYAFLTGYEDDELRALKLQIKRISTTTTTADAKSKSKQQQQNQNVTDVHVQREKDRLKREVMIMTSRRKAQERKDAEQEVRRRHRREEKARVETTGKQPFYLKKAEVKKEALVERYKGMKGKEVDKLVERRRKKKAGREKKNLPRARRGDDDAG